MKIMLDTNVVLDVLLKREPFFQASYEVMKCLALEQAEGFMSATAATDIFHLLRRALKDDMDARDSLENLSQIVKFADALSADVHTALSSRMDHFEDAIVDAIAGRYDMDYIITRNTMDFRNSSVKALTPQEYLNL